MTSTGMNAYKIRKLAVNLDVAPGQVFSMNWTPWVMVHIGWFGMEALEATAKEKIDSISSDVSQVIRSPDVEEALSILSSLLNERHTMSGRTQN